MPKEIAADLGPEWALLEDTITAGGGVLRQKNKAATQTLAVVDRAIGKLKAVLSAYSLTGWASARPKAMRVYNERNHSYLLGIALQRM